MANLQNISVLDRAATPLAHVFTPRDVKEGVGMVVNTAGVPVGEEKMTISMRRVGAKFRGKYSLAIPIVVSEIINGVTSPRIVRTAYATIDVTYDETSTLQERTNLIGMMADSLGVTKTLVHDSLVNLNGVYGT